MELDNELIEKARSATLKHPATLTDKERKEHRAIFLKLDAIFWAKTIFITEQSLSQDGKSLEFSDKNRLWINAGFVSNNLMPIARKETADILIDEIISPSPNEISFITDWLKIRLEQLLSIEASEAHAPDPSHFPENTQDLIKERQTIYREISPLFHSLPGIAESAQESLLSGNLDNRITALIWHWKYTGNESFGKKATQLQNRHNDITKKAQSRTTDFEMFEKFNRLTAIRTSLLRRIPVETAPLIGASCTIENQRKEHIENLRSEINLLRTSMLLGSMAPGQPPNMIPLTSMGRHCTNAEMSNALCTILDIDPCLPNVPQLLIAPYTGEGVYVWDRDTLLIPFKPPHSPICSLAEALASYRLRIDSLQSNGKLKNAYLKATGTNSASFRMSFTGDYCDFIVSCATGDDKSLSEATQNFFAEHIAFNPLINPLRYEMRRWGKKKIASYVNVVQKQFIESQSASYQESKQLFDDGSRFFDLATGQWVLKQQKESLRTLEECVKRFPTNGRFLYTIGLFFAASNHKGKARHYLTIAINKCSDNIWGVLSKWAIKKIK